MPKKQNDHAPHQHTTIYILLSISIVLVVALLGFLIYEMVMLENSDTTPVTQVEDVDTETDDIMTEDDVEDDIPATKTFNQFSDALPTFDYPATWNAVIRDYTFEGVLTRVVGLNDEPTWICEGCDATMGPITISSYNAADTLGHHESFEAYVENTNSGIAYSDVVIENIDAQTYHVSGRTDAFFSADYERIIFNAGDHLIVVTYYMEDGVTDTAEVWDIVSNSLNFSSVE